MSNSPLFQDKEYLSGKQYKNSGNLNARAEIHRRFSVAGTDWHLWVFEHLALKPGDSVLECGCGPGWLWRSNLERIPHHCNITLTDLSAGMVEEAEQALGQTKHNFHFETANIQALQFEDSRFDVVAANHMLYHVPDLNRALSEIERVLKPGGRFLAATNGNGHMRQLWEMAAQVFGPAVRTRWALSFNLENGKTLLQPWFANIVLYHYDDALAVTETEPLAAYVLSTTATAYNVTPEMETKLRQYINREIENAGAFHISKATGLFECETINNE